MKYKCSFNICYWTFGRYYYKLTRVRRQTWEERHYLLLEIAFYRTTGCSYRRIAVVLHCHIRNVSKVQNIRKESPHVQDHSLSPSLPIVIIVKRLCVLCMYMAKGCTGPHCSLHIKRSVYFFYTFFFTFLASFGKL